MIEGFSIKTQEELNYYVYVLIDPRDNKIFYVGKGTRNRVFSHINEALTNPTENEKLSIIRSIKNDNLKVKYLIVRHALEESEAFLVESVLIDFITFKDFIHFGKIANLVSGHNSFNHGIKTANECEILYNCQELKSENIHHNIILININKSYDDKRKKKNENPIYHRANIYEATRGWWVLNKYRAESCDFVLAEYRGVVRAIYKPLRWQQNIELHGPKRWGFEGVEVSDKEILDIYMNKSVPKIKGAANPIRYFDKMI